MEIRIYEREKLYKEVWAEPMVKVAEHYNVSDVALKKTCKKLNIPVPGRGHWARIYAGEKIKTPSLPEQKGNDKIIVRNYSDRVMIVVRIYIYHYPFIVASNIINFWTSENVYCRTITISSNNVGVISYAIKNSVEVVKYLFGRLPIDRLEEILIDKISSSNVNKKYIIGFLECHYIERDKAEFIRKYGGSKAKKILNEYVLSKK